MRRVNLLTAEFDRSSTKPQPDISICVYPDSDKVSVWPPGGRYRMSETLGYWDGEA